MAKRLCVDDEEEKGQQVSADSREPVTNPPVILGSVDVNRNEERTGSETSGPGPKPIQCPSGDTAQRLRKEVKDKTETLRRLKMVQMYRSKVSATFKLNRICFWLLRQKLVISCVTFSHFSP